jgi:glutathione peroxidase-family protein
LGGLEANIWLFLKFLITNKSKIIGNFKNSLKNKIKLPSTFLTFSKYLIIKNSQTV